MIIEIFYCPLNTLKTRNELAITSQSDYLVTSNTKDFKNAELKFDQLKIITPNKFLKKWE